MYVITLCVYVCVYVEGENMEKKDTCKSECTCKSTYEDDPGLIAVYRTDAKIHHNYLTIASCPEHSEFQSSGSIYFVPSNPQIA